jgi:hypothetical protein
MTWLAADHDGKVRQFRLIAGPEYWAARAAIKSRYYPRNGPR